MSNIYPGFLCFRRCKQKSAQAAVIKKYFFYLTCLSFSSIIT